MSEDVIDGSSEATLLKPHAFHTIVYGGVVVGILDLLFAFTFYGLILGAQPLQFFSPFELRFIDLATRWRQERSKKDKTRTRRVEPI